VPKRLRNLAALGLVTVAAAVTSHTEIAAQTNSSVEGPGDPASVARHVTQGLARPIVDNLYACPVQVQNHRRSAVGTITATDGTVITVPAQTAYQKGDRGGVDLHNECTRTDPKTLPEVEAIQVPVVEIDSDGTVITGYLMADNYFELYVNGSLVAVDSVPFTPMNASIVRFRVKRPYTLVFKLVDWEENLGVASELNRSNPWHPGDGGLIARFSDGTVTDSTWRAQSFYVGPLSSPEEVVEKRGNVHDTSKLGRTHPLAKYPSCTDQCYAVHYPVPDNWETSLFSDGIWPRAFEYTDEEIGVNAMIGYTRFPELFEDARWIWSSNLVFDNVVIARKTVR
jgi:hypothetical protein